MRNKNFIEVSIITILSFLEETIFVNDYALKRGLLQSIEPRLKLFSFAMFILCVIFAKDLSQLAILYAICIFLAYLSRIDLRYFLKRTFIFIPLFSILIAIPALFNIFSPGESLFILRIFGIRLVITREGFGTAILFISRVLISVSYIVLLSLTTPHIILLRTLQIFRVPKIFVMILGMCYRYIYLFLWILIHTYLSIKSRTGGLVDYKKGHRIIAWNIGYLWERSYGLSQEVYNAMLSRGYNGEVNILEGLRIQPKDIVWAAFAAGICIFVITLHI